MAVDDVIITFSYPVVLVQQLLHGDHLVLWEPGPGTVQEAPGSVPGESFEVVGQDPPPRGLQDLLLGPHSPLCSGVHAAWVEIYLMSQPW